MAQTKEPTFPRHLLDRATLHSLMEALGDYRAALPMAGIFPGKAEEARQAAEQLYRLAEASGQITPEEAPIFQRALKLRPV